jgi:hypothetical protein
MFFTATPEKMGPVIEKQKTLIEKKKEERERKNKKAVEETVNDAKERP